MEKSSATGFVLNSGNKMKLHSAHEGTQWEDPSWFLQENAKLEIRVVWFGGYFFFFFLSSYRVLVFTNIFPARAAFIARDGFVTPLMQTG